MPAFSFFGGPVPVCRRPARSTCALAPTCTAKRNDPEDSQSDASPMRLTRADDDAKAMVDSDMSQLVTDRLYDDISSTPPSEGTSRGLQALPVQLDLLAYHARVASRRDPKTAERLYRRAIDTNSADGRGWLGLARLHARRGDVTAARRTFKAGVSATVANAHILQAWGIMEQKNRNHARAKGLYIAATRVDPQHCASWVSLGLFEQKIARDVYAARECFQRGVEADPKNYYVWHAWGVLEQQLGNMQKARQCFRNGVRANPKNAATYVVWGVLEYRARRYKDAERLFIRARDVNPRNTHALVAYAILSEARGEVGKARRLLSEAIAIRTRDAGAYQTFGMLEMRSGDFEAARRMFARGLKADRRHAPTYLAWAMMEEMSGDLYRARKLFQDGVWANPRSPQVVRLWHAWAGLERRDGCVDVARRLYAHGLRVQGDSSAILSSWAVMEASQGDLQSARSKMEEVVRLYPQKPEVWRRYESLERSFGSLERAAKISARAAVCENVTDRRLVVSEAMPGDFAAGGMWIDVADAQRSEIAPLMGVREQPSRAGKSAWTSKSPRKTETSSTRSLYAAMEAMGIAW